MAHCFFFRGDWFNLISTGAGQSWAVAKSHRIRGGSCPSVEFLPSEFRTVLNSWYRPGPCLWLIGFVVANANQFNSIQPRLSVCLSVCGLSTSKRTAQTNDSNCCLPREAHVSNSPRPSSYFYAGWPLYGSCAHSGWFRYAKRDLRVTSDLGMRNGKGYPWNGARALYALKISTESIYLHM